MPLKFYKIFFPLYSVGKSDRSLATRLQRALKNFGLNDTSGIETKNVNLHHHIIIAGPPESGKATLVSAICGQPFNKSTKSSSTDSAYTCYEKSYDRHGSSYTVTFWSIVGKEEWSESDVEKSIIDISNKNAPVFLLFCAAPTNHLYQKKVQWILKICIEKNIFCAFIRTNMFAAVRNSTTLTVFEKVLSAEKIDGEDLMKRTQKNTSSGCEDIQIYYNKKTNQPVALMCSVNSIELKRNDQLINPCGLFEFMLTMFDLLSDPSLNQTIYVMLKNRPFWEYVEQIFAKQWQEAFVNNFRLWYQTHL